jgi:tyrosine-protein kinase Etk/Wzc
MTNHPMTSGNPLRPQEIDLFEYLSIILRRRKIFITAFLAVFIAVAVYTFTMKPVYEASSTLHVKEDKGKGNLLGELSLTAANPVNAELEILKSRTNAEEVVKRLGLNWEISDRSDGLEFEIAEFTSTDKKPSYKIELTSPTTFKMRHNGDVVVEEGRSGQILKTKNLSLLLNIKKGEKGDKFKIDLLSFDDAVEALRNRIKAAEVGRMTSIIRVSYTDNNPVLARDIVNALVQAYLEKSVSLKAEEASRTVQFVEDQLDDLRKNLDASEINLQSYKSANGVMKLDTEAEELIRNIAEMEKNKADVALQKKQFEFALNALTAAMRKGEIYSPAVMRDDPLVASLAAKLSELEVQKKSLLADYTANHPAVKNTQEQINEIQKKIHSTYVTKISNLNQQLNTLNSQMNVYEKQMRNLPEAERDLARLTRISKVNADIYTFLLQKHEEARIARASTISNIDIVDPAITPAKPIKPNIPKYLLLGLLFACVISTALVFFQEYLDDTIKDAEQAKQVLGMPLLGVIPHIPSHESNGHTHDTISLFTKLEPKSSVAEAFRSLRTSLHFSAINKDKKILLITSTFPEEGKSVICANLANIFSQTGARVLIIDCDLRRSSLHEKFGHSKTPGLSEILTSDVTFLEARHNTGISGLDLITAGTAPPNPSELLGSEQMKQFLLDRRQEYDFIILDAPPVMAVTDAPVLTAVVDMTILIIEAMRVPIKVAQHVRELLISINAPVAGFVMNNKSEESEAYQYYGSRYYRYGYKYGYRYGHGYHYYSDRKPEQKPKYPFWEEDVLKLQKSSFMKKLISKIKR